MNVISKSSTQPEPSNSTISFADLPCPQTSRWVARRKAQVVYAVQEGVISLADACERYSLSVEEFLCWQRAIAKNGLDGLRTTRIQQYRSKT
jgi:hypothetical protein